MGRDKPELLSAAANYAVFDLRGRRIGLVIELVDDPESDGQRLAIRRDGAFFSRRRLLPLDAVETVDAERRFVVVDEDREAARVAATPEGIDEDSLARLYYYTRPESVRNGEEAARDLKEEERSVTLSAPAVSDRYLRFVSTPDGYRLDEQAGEPPAVGTLINGIDLPERLLVIKLGPSPLPHDPRVCAFLEREIPLAASPGRSRT
jgi:PRC-barrel domain protein